MKAQYKQRHLQFIIVEGNTKTEVHLEEDSF